MKLEAIYQTLQRSTASGHGQSYWQVAANCGERRYLSDLHKEIAAQDEHYLEQKKLGTFYHGLKDLWWKGGIDGVVIDVGDVLESEWQQAIKLFRFAIEEFPKPYWGTLLASEYRFPSSEEHKAAIRAFFGHDDLTGAADRVFYWDEATVRNIENDRQIELRGPGIYLVDDKTAGARASDQKASGSYLNSIQSMVYPLLWNLQGGEPCKGILFDVIVNHKDLRRHDVDKRTLSSVQTFFAPWNESRDLRARSAINFARAQRDSRVKNPFACESYDGYRCPFLANGVCDGI